MDKQLIGLHKAESLDALRALIQDISYTDLSGLIDIRVLKGRGDPGVLIRAILAGLSGDVSVLVKRRLSVYRHCISLLQRDELHSKMAADVVGILMIGVDEFGATSLAELASQYVEDIKNGAATGKSLELFPKILSSLEVQPTVTYDDRQMSGTEYKNHILNSLCSGRWNAGTVLHLAAMFKDVPMSQDELRFVLTKIVRMLKEVEIQELPPLVYQLLLLSNKGHKKLVLEGIIQHFVVLDKQVKAQQQSMNGGDELQVMAFSADQLAVVEGTIILHVSFAIKQDQDLGRQLLKYLKIEQQSPTSLALMPFCVALTLSCSKIHRFEDQVIEFLKAAVLKSFRDQEKQDQSWWARDMVTMVTDITPWIMDTIKNSVHGWDHVVQGLVQLGFTLMDAFGPKAAFGRISEVNLVTAATPTQRACKLGAQILLETFKVHEMVRPEILEQILNRVVTKATAPVSHYLDLLSETVKSAPQILLDSLPKVREAFDYLSYLPPTMAQALLKAVQPLLKISMTLKDALILILRKAMFSRQTDARRTAVQGFLMILKHFKVLGGIPYSQASQSMSSSQAMVDVHIPYNASNNEGLCLEILGNLRRCLTQQAEVRMTLYEGLYEVLCRNTQLSGPILGTLYRQLQLYYEATPDVNPPVKLEPCIVLQGDEVYTQEPLAHLLCCVVQCYLKVRGLDTDQIQGDDEDAEDTDLVRHLEDMLESITLRMVKSELEDFELDRSADFSLSTGVGIRNNIFALLVAGTYESLLEYTFITGDLEVTSCETVLQLFKGYTKVMDILKDKPTTGGAAAGGKRGRAMAGKSTSAAGGSGKQKSLLSLGLLRKVIKALYSDELPDHQEGLSCLRDDLDFQRYILSVTLQKVTQLSQSGSCEGAEGHEPQKMFTYCTSIARVIQKHYTTDVENKDGDRRERHKQINITSLEILTTIYTIVCTQHKDELPTFLATLDRSRDSDVTGDLDLHDLLFKLIKKLQRLLMSVISAEEDSHSSKEAVSLLTIITTLTKQLGVEGERGAQIVAWVQRICTEHTVDDVAVVKHLVLQLFQLTTQRSSCVQLLREVAKDIHSQLGDIDQEVDLDETSVMSMINQRTAAPTILLLLLSHIDRELDDTEWVLSRTKGSLSAADNLTDGGDSPDLTQRETNEKGLCNRLGHLVNTFHELSQSAVPVGVCVETLLKVLIRLYSVLTGLAKYYLQIYQQKSGQLSARFEKLVKLSGTNLTQYVYAMITYIQATQNESLQLANEKAKKDKKKQEAAAQAGRNRVLKESKSIPNLIFAIEQYERYLIQLSKKSKVNLMDHFKMSTSRDFRINAASLQEALVEESEDDEDATADQITLGSSGDSDEENQEAPSAKRSKLTQPHKGLKVKITKNLSNRSTLKKKNT